MIEAILGSVLPLLIIAILIAVAVYYFGSKIEACLSDPIGCLTGSPSITSANFGKAYPLGDPNGPTCNPDGGPNLYDYYGGVCYKKCHDPKVTADGIHDPDPSNGWTRTAVYTCAKTGGKTITDVSFGASILPICDANKEISGGLCYSACPYAWGGVGKRIRGKRTAVATCWYGNGNDLLDKSGNKIGTVNNIAGYALWSNGNFGNSNDTLLNWLDNNPQDDRIGYAMTYPGQGQCGGAITGSAMDSGVGTVPQGCTDGYKFNAGLCYPTWDKVKSILKSKYNIDADKDGYTQTAVSTVSNVKTVTDSSLYGNAGTPTNCPKGGDYYGSMCYVTPCSALNGFSSDGTTWDGKTYWKRIATMSCGVMTQTEVDAAKAAGTLATMPAAAPATNPADDTPHYLNAHFTPTRSPFLIERDRSKKSYFKGYLDTD